MDKRDTVIRAALLRLEFLKACLGDSFGITISHMGTVQETLGKACWVQWRRMVQLDDFQYAEWWYQGMALYGVRHSPHSRDPHISRADCRKAV